MCAIIGAYVKGTPKGINDLLRKVFIESSIRGLHATGLTYVKNNKLHTIKQPIPADQFSFDFDDYWNEDGNLYLIGHCRYSTSDLEYNQPISNDEFSIVHNGVVSQESPDKWKELFGGSYETRNDSEILLNAFTFGRDPLYAFSDSSISTCLLSKSKQLTVVRNGKRPCYISSTDDYNIVTSTKDIAVRSGLENTERMGINNYLYLNPEMSDNIEVNIEAEDLQP